MKKCNGNFEAKDMIIWYKSGVQILPDQCKRKIWNTNQGNVLGLVILQLYC